MIKKVEKNKDGNDVLDIRFATIKETANLYKHIYTETALRNLFCPQRRKINGLEKVIIQKNRKIIIDLDKFEQWLEKDSPN